MARMKMIKAPKRLNERQVIRLRIYREEGKKLKDLATLFGISKSAVCRIARRQRRAS